MTKGEPAVKHLRMCLGVTDGLCNISSEYDVNKTLGESKSTKDRDISLKVIDVLNEAFSRDPNAIHAMFSTYVPCNEKLADGPYIIVSDVIVAQNSHEEHITTCHRVGVLGLLNGILVANGLPKIAMIWADGKISADKIDYPKFLGFCLYE